ncbi:MAG: hypothetical protein H6511_02000 [Holophagales bacterium]|nr:hypothetical protein [Holophagales bacterium]
MRHSRGLVLLLLAPVALWVAWGFWGVSYDDGYITYRYARNLADGRGLVFNDGERVLGTSAPGYAATLGLLTVAGRPLGLGVEDVGSLLFFASLLGLAAAIARRGALAVPLLFGALALVSRFDLELSGCETLPALALMAIAFRLAWDGERPVAAGLLGGLATTFRLDSGLALAALGVALWVRSRRFPARFALAGGAPIVATLAALAAYYGSFVPTTLAGKRSELALAASGYGAAEWAWLERVYGVGGALALLALAGVGVVALWRRAGAEPHGRLALAALASWLVAHEIFYRAVGVPFSPWYQVHLFPALLLAAAAGAWSLAAVGASIGGFARGGAWRRAGFAAVLALPLAAPSLAYALGQRGLPPDPRIRVYRDVARAADRCLGAPGGAIAAVEIGALGYFTERPVLDLVGLVDPELRRAKQEGRLTEALLARHPDFLVDHPTFREPFWAPVLATEEVRSQFETVGTFRRPEYPPPVRLLARRGACSSSPVEPRAP